MAEKKQEAAAAKEDLPDDVAPIDEEDVPGETRWVASPGHVFVRINPLFPQIDQVNVGGAVFRHDQPVEVSIDSYENSIKNHTQFRGQQHEPLVVPI